MTDINHLNMNDAIQFGYALSKEVQEPQYNDAAQHAYQKVEQSVVLKNNHQDVTFGRTEPVPPDIGEAVNIRDRGKMGNCLGIVVLFLLILLGAIHLASKTSSSDLDDTSENKYQSLMMKKENECDYSNTMLEDKLDINIDNEILALMAHDEPNVQDMFKEMFVTENIDNSTYELVASIPTDPQNDKHLIYDDNEKTGQTSSPIADSGFAFEIEQDGAVSRKNVNIPEETSAISLRDELVV